MEQEPGSSLDGSFEPYPNSHGPNVTVNTLTADYVITNLGIGTQAQQSFLRDPNNVEITAALADYIDKLQIITQDNIEFGQWTVRYLMINSGVSFEELRNNLINTPFEFDPSQEAYVPRDKEPASYYWRPKLENAENFNEYLTLIPVETDPKDLFNCHYHAFGDVPGAIKQPGSPKHILAMDVNLGWEKVKGNIQVGDRIGYYMPNAAGTKPVWVHSGIVIEIDGEGYATKISSKMGPYYEIIEHHPRDIPKSYGSNEATFVVNGKTEPSRIYWRKK